MSERHEGQRGGCSVAPNLNCLCQSYATCRDSTKCPFVHVCIREKSDFIVVAYIYTRLNMPGIFRETST